MDRCKMAAAVTLALATGGCAAPRMYYNGCKMPPAVHDGEDVKVFGGKGEAPHRHVVLGTVVVASDQASDTFIVANYVRPKAAAAGGTAIHGVDCETRYSVDDWGDFTAGTTTCGARVLRSLDADDPVVLEEHGDEMMWLERTPVAVASPSSSPQLSSPRQEPAHVGTLDVHPRGYVHFGTMVATCEGSCARSTLERALRIGAAKRGALAVAELRCELDLHVSRCVGELVGPALDTVVSPDQAPPKLAAD